MRVTCVGGGPAGLYFCLLMKLRNPQHDVVLLERNATGATYGWGVTLEQDLFGVLRGNDPVSAEALERASLQWTHQAVHVGRERTVEGGYSIHSVGRQALVDILTSRARDAGVRMSYSREVTGLAELPPSDLIVAADGVRSRLRSAVGGFGTGVREGRNRYMWLGSSAPFDMFNYIFAPTDHGWVWAYGYRFHSQASTVVVECSPQTWTGLGFDAMPTEEGVGLLSELFKDQLGGHRLIARLPDGTTARWLNFPTVTNKRWHAGNVVLAGDSAHTAHYSLGQGTTMALKDAIALADSLCLHADVETALTAYETRRKAELAGTLRAARRSSQWFEGLQRYIRLEPHQFAVVLHARWSPLVGILPPRLTYWLRRAKKRSAVREAIDHDSPQVLERRN
jgi:2-polyprenyl-6-methoxyphenol hydroxylase-like FAD-dependent oxidoreductase